MHSRTSSDDAPSSGQVATEPERGRQGPGRSRRRPPPRLVEVTSVSRPAEWLVSVVVSGDGLKGFAPPAPTSHIKVFFPSPGEDAPALPTIGPDGPVWPEDMHRPVVRTYTPRRFDELSCTLEVQFVLHGSGPASDWAREARVGDRLGIAGPGGRFSLDPAAESWWVGGDESAVPAIATLLDALPASTTAEVHLEISDGYDELPLVSAAPTAVTWHHRQRADSWGKELYEAARGATFAPGTRVWVACEATAVRVVRAHLLAERGLPATSVVTRGYWRLGVADHPDHDYGEN